MSSICGMFRRDGGNAGRAGIERMVEALAHWQPDATGSWIQGAAGLGHVGLHVAPERESQPWLSPDGHLVVAADARIDNREELFASLGVPARDARGMSDAALIAEAYRKWGDSSPAFLAGDFAFALWDVRHQRLLCARDIIGVRPFYYVERNAFFAFASEIKGIFAHPAVDVPRTLNERALAEILLRIYGDRSSTVYEHVRSLPAAHSLIVTAAGIKLGRYWDPEAVSDIRFARDDDYAEAYRELLTRAVSSRVRTTAPVATTLSGIDSASVTWLAREASGRNGNRLVGLSWLNRSPAEARDAGRERYAGSFLAAAPIDHEYVSIDPGRAFHPPLALFQFHDGPIRDRRFDVMDDTFNAAAAHDARVLLFGLGGDELATSHAPDYLLHLMFRGRPGRLVSEIRAQARARGETIAGIVRSEILRPLLTSTARTVNLAYRQKHRPLDPAVTAGRPGFLRMAGSGSRPIVSAGLSLRNPVRANQLAMMFQGPFQYAMETRYSAAARFRMECRFPMFDRRLIEFCLGVPPAQHRDAGHARRLVRRAMAGRIPDSILWGPKDGGRAVRDLTHYAEQAPAIRRALERWRRQDAITTRLDLPRMEAQLQSCLRGDVRAPGHLERAFLLASFFEWHAGQV